MKKKFDFLHALIIFIIIDVLLWGLTFTVSNLFSSFHNAEIGETLYLISGYILLLLFLTLLVALIIYQLIRIIKCLLKNKVLFYIFLIIFSISIFCLLASDKILSDNKVSDNKFIVPIVDINKNKIIVDIANYNKGDEKLIEVKKPFYINLKKGDSVYIYLDNNNYETAKYIVDYKYGIILLLIGYVLSISLIIIMIVSVKLSESKIK